MLSTSLIHDIFKGHQIVISQISLLESKLPHQYDFNKFQFDYEGVLGQTLLTETQNFFFSRGINATLHQKRIIFGVTVIYILPSPLTHSTHDIWCQVWTYLEVSGVSEWLERADQQHHSLAGQVVPFIYLLQGRPVTQRAKS